jgi:hypothetical protein
MQGNWIVLSSIRGFPKRCLQITCRLVLRRIIVKGTARPNGGEVYGAMDMGWVKLVGQITQVGGCSCGTPFRVTQSDSPNTRRMSHFERSADQFVEKEEFKFPPHETKAVFQSPWSSGAKSVVASIVARCI